MSSGNTWARTINLVNPIICPTCASEKPGAIKCDTSFVQIRIGIAIHARRMQEIVIIVFDILHASCCFPPVIYFVYTGMNADVKAPITRSSKRRLGSRNAAKYTPSSSGENRAANILSRSNPKIRDVNTIMIRTVAAERTEDCLFQKNDHSLFITNYYIAILP
jgi:hypothetical protein